MQPLGSIAEAPVLLPSAGVPPIRTHPHEEGTTAEVVLDIRSGTTPSSSPRLTQYASPKAGTTAVSRMAPQQQQQQQRGPPKPKRRITYGTRQPLKKEASIVAIIIMLLYLAAVSSPC